MPDRRSAHLLALFAAAIILLNFPVLSVVHAIQTATGAPIVPFYLFACWGGIIALAAFLVERRRGD
jgi:hypothetical protein